MELIKSTVFTNSFTNEHLVTIALYRREVSYAILSEFGYKINGQTRLGKFEAEEYYFEVIEETKKSFYSMEQPFTTKTETNFI